MWAWTCNYLTFALYTRGGVWSGFQLLLFLKIVIVRKVIHNVVYLVQIRQEVGG